MSHLTIDKMDRINFLITEVSLECLGNKFYDIYGRQNKSLLGLISVTSGKRDPTSVDSDSESDLWKALTTEKKPIIQKRNRTVESHVAVEEPKRKRRASTNTNNKPDTSNDPEELLVPMATVPKAAKITQRRSTISVQSQKLPVIAPATRARKHDQLLTNPRQLTPKPYSKKIAEIKQNLKRDINIRNNAMRLLSESQEEKYRTLNINANMDDFYKAEEKSLFSQCNTLIQFIKFIQENGDNPTKVSHISQAILELQKEY